MLTASDVCALQWGPVVVTGISTELVVLTVPARALQWGPVVVTGISDQAESVPRPCPTRLLQWGPVVVTGISPRRVMSPPVNRALQ